MNHFESAPPQTCKNGDENMLDARHRLAQLEKEI